jgi:SAM-dependent methyltransferase
MAWIRSLTEFCVLSALYFKVLFINFSEYIKVVGRYYSNPMFRSCDLSLLGAYLFANPFRISKRFLIQTGSSNLYTYGETPLTTLDRIARTCGLTDRDLVVELGCGRGRTCFWLNQFIGCSVIGIEYVPDFVEKARMVQKKHHASGIEFRLEDLFQADLDGATAVYLYGTCYSAEEIDRLIERFSRLPEGTKIITVSYALTDFQPLAPFLLVKQFPAPFTWGTAIVSLQIRRKRGRGHPSATLRG